jgi:hypothetical protein
MSFGIWVLQIGQIVLGASVYETFLTHNDPQMTDAEFDTCFTLEMISQSLYTPDRKWVS